MGKQMDMKRHGDIFIIDGLRRLVEESGMTPHEAFEVLEDIKRQTWHALADIHAETKGVVPK